MLSCPQSLYSVRGQGDAQYFLYYFPNAQAEVCAVFLWLETALSAVESVMALCDFCKLYPLLPQVDGNAPS